MKLFKLTDEHNETKNNIVWGEYITHSLPIVANPQLCSNHVFHAYKDKNLALLLNPIHADIRNFNLWEAEGNIIKKEWDKVGCFTLTTIKQREIPFWYSNLKIRLNVFIKFSKKVDAAAAYAADAAAYAADAATYAADAATYAAAYSAADATRAAADAADAVAGIITINFKYLAKQAIKEAIQEYYHVKN